MRALTSVGVGGDSVRAACLPVLGSCEIPHVEIGFVGLVSGVEMSGGGLRQRMKWLCLV